MCMQILCLGRVERKVFLASGNLDIFSLILSRQSAKNRGYKKGRESSVMENVRSITR